MKKKRKKSLDKYANISPDKPLIPREKDFCLRYIKTKDITASAIAAGYSPRTAAKHGWKLVHEKPNTRKFIEDHLNRFFERLEVEAFDVLQKTVHIAMTNAQELTYIENGRVVVTETDDWSEGAKALFAGAEERINERGDISIRVKYQDQNSARNKLFDYFKLMKKGEQESKGTLYKAQIDAIESVQSGEKTVMDACLNLEKMGLSIPETLRILLSKTIVEDADIDDGDSVVPTAEEMDAMMQKRLKEVEGQKEKFVPQRQAEVREMKDELGLKNEAFLGDVDGEKEGS